MKVKDLDDFQSPNRKPWLLVLILVLAALFVYRRRHAGEDVDAGADPELPDGTTEQVVERPADTRSPERRAPLSGVGFDRLISQAELRESSDDLAGARERYLEALRVAGSSSEISDVERRLGAVGIKLVTTPSGMPEKAEYVVKGGDSVEKIARRFGTTIELIQKGNLLKNANIIKVGDRFLVLAKPFEIRVSKSRRDLVVLLDGTFFKRYRVGIGKFGKTPVGTFEIYDRIPKPVWWRPDGREIPFGDPENILGTRWMAIRATGDTPKVRGYGIHGTWDDQSIGKAESAGCIRMKNPDVEELFSLVPNGTVVTIVE